MAVHNVEVTVDKLGNITVSPTSLHAESGDSVSWTSHSGKLLVSFKGPSPFDVLEIRGNQGVATKPKPFKSGVPPGVYHYLVVVAAPGGPAITHGCPEIIVET